MLRFGTVRCIQLLQLRKSKPNVSSVSDSWQLPNAALDISDMWKALSLVWSLLQSHQTRWDTTVVQWSMVCLNHQHLALSLPAVNVLFSNLFIFLNKGVKMFWVLNCTCVLYLTSTLISLSLVPSSAHLQHTQKKSWAHVIPFGSHLLLQFAVHLQHCKKQKKQNTCEIMEKQSREQFVNIQAVPQKKHTLQFKSLRSVGCFNVFESLLCSPRLQHHFCSKTQWKHNIVKYYYNIK